MIKVKSHVNPHEIGFGPCTDDDCTQEHQSYTIMGTIGRWVYRCEHIAHAVTWSELTPVGHCARDKHPDKIGQCPEGCTMQVELQS